MPFVLSSRHFPLPEAVERAAVAVNRIRSDRKVSKASPKPKASSSSNNSSNRKASGVRVFHAVAVAAVASGAATNRCRRPISPRHRARRVREADGALSTLERVNSCRKATSALAKTAAMQDRMELEESG